MIFLLQVGESPRLTAIAELLEEAVQREDGRGTVLEARKIIHLVDSKASDDECYSVLAGPRLPAWPCARAQKLLAVTCTEFRAAWCRIDPPYGSFLSAGPGGAGPRGCRAPGGSQAAVRSGGAGHPLLPSAKCGLCCCTLAWGWDGWAAARVTVCAVWRL